jgi:tetratricopeptide (TPR) repeat protein
MRESVRDQSGIQFARTLCDELAQKERIDFALQTARAAMQTALQYAIKKAGGGEPEAEPAPGQWCLPMLLSPQPERLLIDWDFQPLTVETRAVNQSLQNISLPARFIGRRAEMRQFKSQILQAKVQKLLITGPGGQGKTTLAGKLAQDLEGHGYRLFAWSGRPENQWRKFQLAMETSLEGKLAASYDRAKPGVENEAELAELLFGKLLEQTAGRLVLFLDNLETLQGPDSLALKDPQVAAWLETAQKLPGLALLATSRWELPGWPGEHLLLAHTRYGDFLQMAQLSMLSGQLPVSFLKERERLRHIYDVLGGNGRGLEFFAAAVHNIVGKVEENAFLERLASTEADLQANMAIAEIYERLPEKAKTLLDRLPVYSTPVPEEGILKLGLDLDEHPELLLARLLAVSLVEAQAEPHWQVIQYQCSPLVADWLRGKGLVDEAPAWMDAAADYQVYLYNNERHILGQAIAAHTALRRAGRKVQADRLALNHIVSPLSLAGFFRTLLSDWLPDICASEDLVIRGVALGQTGDQLLSIGDYEAALVYLKQSLAMIQQIGDKKGEGVTLNNISQIFKAQGDYETALAYLKQSLAIQQQIGDRAGLYMALFNMGHIHAQNKEIQEARSAWVTAYVIAKQIGLAQVLQALAELAPHLNMPPGLEGWEELAKKFNIQT